MTILLQKISVEVFRILDIIFFYNSTFKYGFVFGETFFLQIAENIIKSVMELQGWETLLYRLCMLIEWLMCGDMYVI